MIYKDYLNLIEPYGKMKKCIHCEGYQGAIERLKKDAPTYLDMQSSSGTIFPDNEIYGFLGCTICPPLEILEEYLQMEGKRKFLKPRKKKFTLEDFSVKLFLRKISGDI
jgi:hypothetical protein